MKRKSEESKVVERNGREKKTEKEKKREGQETEGIMRRKKC